MLLLIGSSFWDVGLAFKSGTECAMIYETCQQIRKRKLFMEILAKISSFYQLGALIAAFIATFVTYYFSLQTLVWIATLPSFFNIFVIALMVNPRSYFKKGISPQKQLKKSVYIFIKNRTLRHYAILQILNDALANSVFRFEASYYEKLIPIYFINIARALQHTTGWISYYIATLFTKNNLLKLLCFSTFGSSLIRFISLIINNSITPFIASMQNLFYGTVTTSSSTLLQKEYNKGLRATLDSIVGFFGGITTSLIGFLLGFAADIFSPRILLLVTVFCSLGIALVYNRLFKPVRIN